MNASATSARRVRGCELADSPPGELATDRCRLSHQCPALSSWSDRLSEKTQRNGYVLLSRVLTSIGRVTRDLGSGVGHDEVQGCDYRRLRCGCAGRRTTDTRLGASASSRLAGVR